MGDSSLRVIHATQTETLVTRRTSELDMFECYSSARITETMLLRPQWTGMVAMSHAESSTRIKRSPPPTEF